jgi:two-component system, NtrC family, response regulator GlrR
MLGKSDNILKIIELIRKMSLYEAPVLIEGETGTGKEVVARSIHYGGNRHNKPFIPVNCGAIPDNLFESEVFGHFKGAFTDAKNDHPGMVGLAGDGSIFLDEVDSLSAKGQVTLLRFLQDYSYRPVGGNREIQSKVRVIAASNTNLCNQVEKGLFRRDLFYRLNILYINLPPLRERQGDIKILAEYFIKHYSCKLNCSPKCFHPDTLTWFEKYSWPGNIRELENLVYREFLMCQGDVISIPPLEDHEIDRRRTVIDRRCYYRNDLSFQEAKEMAVLEFEKRYLFSLLSDSNGNVTLAAKLAGKERRCLGKLIKKHLLVPRDFISLT